MNFSFSLYRLVARATLPLALWRLNRTARDYPGLRARWPERRGRVPNGPGGELWVHAASAGEVNAAAPLIQQLIEQRPAQSIVISTHTHTGALRVESLFAGTGRVRHLFAPLDTPGAVRRWLERVDPAAGLVVETELWPELFHACARRNIPLALVNARISEKAFGHYRRFRGLFAGALQGATLALCQSDDDAARLQALGLAPDRTRVTGNLKFDFALPASLEGEARQLRQHWGQRPVWVAGSTHEGEEAVAMKAHRRVLTDHPDALLVLVPRHPERGRQILAALRADGIRPVAMGTPGLKDQSAVVLDRMGILLACYRAAQVCFVGGSLAPKVGGHNLLEPALCARPAITGPFVSEQKRICQALKAAGALVQVTGADELGRAVTDLLGDPARALAMGSAGEREVRTGRGAVARTLRDLGPWLSDQPARTNCRPS